MPFHGLDGHEQRLRDLTVGHARGREVGDAALASRQRIDSGGRAGPWPAASRAELVARVPSEWLGTAGSRDLESASKWRSSGSAVAGAAEAGTEVDKRPSVLEPGQRTLERGDRFLEEGDAASASFDEPCGAQRNAEAAWRTEDPAELEFLGRELPCLFVRPEPMGHECCGRAPVNDSRILSAPRSLAPAAFHEITERHVELALGDAQLCSAE